MRKAIIGTLLATALQSVLDSRTPDLLTFDNWFDTRLVGVNSDDIA